MFSLFVLRKPTSPESAQDQTKNVPVNDSSIRWSGANELITIREAGWAEGGILSVRLMEDHITVRGSLPGNRPGDGAEETLMQR